MSQNVNIVYKSDDLVAIIKPVGLPSESDSSGQADALSLTSKQLLSMNENSKLWLLHRLDTVVGGLLLFARNKRTAAELSSIISTDGFEKTYAAVCFGEAFFGKYSDYLLKDSIRGMATLSESGIKGAKLAELYCDRKALIEHNGRNMSLVSVKLKTGRFHQIRAQMSIRKTPIVGDKKYGGYDTERRTPALFATKLSFSYKGEKIEISALPDMNEYPWSLFEKDLF